MTITIDQLIQVLMKEETDDAGMRAVVRALRDHFHKKTGTWEPGWPQVEVDILFEDILGEAGNEKVADSGGAFEGLMDGLAKACATDPAPVNVAKMQRTLLRKWRKAREAQR